MSLTSFVALPDVKDKLKPFRPPPPRKIGVPIKVARRATKDHATSIGTAFDYLIRFELERRAPHLVNGREQWVAERAPPLIKLADLSGGNATEIGEQIAATLSHARDLWTAYIGNNSPSHEDMETIATYAMKLAKIDPVARPRRLLPPDYNDVDCESVGELLDLLAIVPWHEFVNSEMLLNPTFPASSHVGGADGDLIVGDMLVDFKTVSRDDHKIETLDQLLGYYLLANHYPGDSLKEIVFPKISRVAIYYGRHGHLWSLSTSFWTDQGGFPELRDWFFAHANQLWGGPAPALQGKNLQGEQVYVSVFQVKPEKKRKTKAKPKKRKTKAKKKPT